MSTANYIKLEVVASINPTCKGIEFVENELVDFLPMAAVDATQSTAAATEFRCYDEVKKGYTPFANGDVLVAKITPCFENGKIAQVLVSKRQGFGSTEFHVVRPHKDKLDGRYLTQFLRCPEIRRDGERKMTGSAGQRRVPKYFLESLPIPLPVIREQRRIAAILDQTDLLRSKRIEILVQLHKLEQSIFIDMFGDPAINTKKFPTGRIFDILASATYGTSEKSSATGSFPVLRMGNITSNGEINLDDLKYMNLKENEFDRYLVQDGDILFNRTNSAELVGKTAIFHHKEKMAYAGYLIRLRTTKQNDPEYLSAFLNSAYAKKMLKGMCKSIIGMANINAKEIQAMRIALPPFETQREFGRRIQAVNKQKVLHRAALAELDALFASLQHRAFRGEL